MDIYGIAWKNLAKKVAATRKQSIRKADLMKWQLEALEEAVDGCASRLADTLAKPIPSEARPRHAQ